MEKLVDRNEEDLALCPWCRNKPIMTNPLMGVEMVMCYKDEKCAIYGHIHQLSKWQDCKITYEYSMLEDECQSLQSLNSKLVEALEEARLVINHNNDIGWGDVCISHIDKALQLSKEQ